MLMLEAHAHKDTAQGKFVAYSLCLLNRLHALSHACCCQTSTMSRHMWLCIHGALFYVMLLNKSVIFCLRVAVNVGHSTQARVHAELNLSSRSLKMN